MLEILWAQSETNMTRRRIPPSINEKMPDTSTFSFEDFIIFMTLYWRYLRYNFRQGIGKKVTLSTLFIMLLDYVRLQAINFII